MSLKWTDSAGILRKNEPFDDNKDELLVFGYSCKLFRDDEKAQHIDQGKHLIPWMGDETLKIDRYDARGTLYDLQSTEPPPGGFDWRHILNDAEKRIELFCDQERYRALFCDEDEEEMYKEEELKRLHASRAGLGVRGVNAGATTSYGEVAFNYDVDSKPKQGNETFVETPLDDDPFVPPTELNLDSDAIVPLTKKHNMIIMKTASFIASHGTQMEILLKTKQAGNSQFDFLSMDCPLNNYYRQVVEAIKNGILKPQAEEIEEKETVPCLENYLHPSLIAPEPIESAPFIPNINYKPSADCAYSILVSKITGTKPPEKEDETDKQSEQYMDGDLAPPGTRPLTLPKDVPPDSSGEYTPEQLAQYYAYYGYYRTPAIEKGPILYAQDSPMAEDQKPLKPPGVDDEDSGLTTKKSLGLNLIAYSDSEGGSGSDDEEDGPLAILMPPADIQLVINKMAAYVVKNGADFEKVVRAKNDARFNFLNPAHQYHSYYKSKLNIGTAPKVVAAVKTTKDEGDQEETLTNANTEKVYQEKLDVQQKEEVRSEDEKKKEVDNDVSKTPTHKSSEKKVKKIAPVSFSIKKLKEPDPILTNTALPYESSTDEEQENNQNESKTTPAHESKESTSSEQPTGSMLAEKSNVENRTIPMSSAQNSTKTDPNGADEEDIITIDEDELIDLTGDLSDDKLAVNGIVDDKQKQMERKRRAAAFLAVMKVRGGTEETMTAAPTASIPVPNHLAETNTLASVMVKTLIDMHTKKDDKQNVKHERRKRRHRDYRNSSSEDSNRGHSIADRKEKYQMKIKRKRFTKSERLYNKPSKRRSKTSHREISSHKKRTKTKERRSKTSPRKPEKCLEILRKVEENIKVKKDKSPARAEHHAKTLKSFVNPLNNFDLGSDPALDPQPTNGTEDKLVPSEGELESSDEESGEIITSSSNSHSETELVTFTYL